MHSLSLAARNRGRTSWRALTCAVLLVAVTLGFPARVTAATTTSIPQADIDSALAVADWQFYNNLQNDLAQMRGARAFFLLALVAYLDSDATHSNGTSYVHARVRTHIENLTTGGKEPNANGSLSGWSHAAVANAFVLAKNTPAIWNALSADKRARVDFIMKAMAVAAHFGFDDQNAYLTDLAYGGNFNKNNPPNYREGYMGVMVAASLYFGGPALNQFFDSSFSYDGYIDTMTGYGFTNMKAAWYNSANRSTAHGTLKSRMESGGQILLPDSQGALKNAGSGTGCRNNPFTYKGVGPDNPFGLFVKLANYMYGVDDQNIPVPHVQTAEVRNNLYWNGVLVAHTAEHLRSPFTGETGMAFEFHAVQGSAPNYKPRSSVKYVYDGWHNSITTRATLQALGRWGVNNGDIATRDDIEARMHVGSEDYLFKAAVGYHSVNGGTAPSPVVSEDYPANNENLNVRGHALAKPIWNHYLRWLPGRLTFTDVGGAGAATRGRATFANGIYTVHGSGTSLWGSPDSFAFLHQSITGDGTVVARVASTPSGKGGIMLRDDLSPGSRYISLHFHAGALKLEGRETAGTTAINHFTGALSAPRWLRLQRIGNNYHGSHSTDGSSWTPAGQAAFAMPSTVHAGLVNVGLGAPTPQAFGNVSIKSLPLPWQSGDVGAVAAAGGARHSGGIFTVSGSGNDIWGSADEFHFVHQPSSGNCEISARVTSLQNTHDRAKVALMIRESLAAGSRHAMVALHKDIGPAFIRRTSTNDLTTSTPATPVTDVPYELRLVRSDNTFTAYGRPAGATTWTTLGSQTIALPSNALIGLAVCGRVDGELNTAVVGNVTVVP